MMDFGEHNNNFKNFKNCRCVWTIGRESYREPSREISVRPGRVLPDSVPESACPLREAPPPASITANRLVPSHRAALLRPARRQNAHRDPHPRYAPLRIQFQLALFAIHVVFLSLSFFHVVL